MRRRVGGVADLVASGLFGGIKTHIRLVDQGFNRLRLIPLHNPDADGDCAGVGKAVIGDLLP